MTIEHRLTAMTDILKLSDEEFERFMPDLAAWHALGRELQAATPTMPMRSMVWFDDGKPGELHSIVGYISGTDEKVFTVFGSAYPREGTGGKHDD